MTVAYSGVLPDLFREGQGVIAMGHVDADGLFRAEEVLAKHDENYMPPEVAASMTTDGQLPPAAPPVSDAALN
jgi:cytochrome c-type biogenesis protein CcmE